MRERCPSSTVDWAGSIAVNVRAAVLARIPPSTGPATRITAAAIGDSGMPVAILAMPVDRCTASSSASGGESHRHDHLLSTSPELALANSKIRAAPRRPRLRPQHAGVLGQEGHRRRVLIDERQDLADIPVQPL